jgi:hypothetical protein
LQRVIDENVDINQRLSDRTFGGDARRKADSMRSSSRFGSNRNCSAVAAHQRCSARMFRLKNSQFAGETSGNMGACDEC